MLPESYWNNSKTYVLNALTPFSGVGKGWSGTTLSKGTKSIKKGLNQEEKFQACQKFFSNLYVSFWYFYELQKLFETIKWFHITFVNLNVAQNY